MGNNKKSQTIEFRWGEKYNKSKSFEAEMPKLFQSQDNKMTFFFQPTEQRKWYEFRKMDKREFGYTAIVGLLAGYIFSSFGGNLILEIIGSILALAGLISGIIWIVLAIKDKLKK